MSRLSPFLAILLSLSICGLALVLGIAGTNLLYWTGELTECQKGNFPKEYCDDVVFKNMGIWLGVMVSAIPLTLCCLIILAKRDVRKKYIWRFKG
jgi:hypothetical protein